MSKPHPKFPKYDAKFLRKAAEYASSIRSDNGIPVWVYVKEDGDLDHKIGGDPPDTTVFEVETKEVEKGRTPPSSVKIAHEGVRPEELVHKYDAVFWSESAVEKFVLPYYASLSMWDAASALEDISIAWYGKIPRAASGDGTGTETNEVIPFALAHTPDSNWKTLPHDSLHMLFKKKGEKAIHCLPVAEFLLKHRGGTG